MSTLLPLVILLIISAIITYIYSRSHTLLTEIFLMVVYLLFSVSLIKDTQTLVLFLLGLVAGYATDCLGVYCKKWSYPNMYKYSMWVGMGWASLTLAMIHAASGITTLQVLPFLIPAVIILVLRSRNLFQFTKYKFVFFLLKVSLIFVSPLLYLLSFAVGILIEFMAVEVYKIWAYKKLAYLQIATGYAGFMMYILILIQVIMGTSAPWEIWLAIAVPVIYSAHILYNMFNHQQISFSASKKRSHSKKKKLRTSRPQQFEFSFSKTPPSR